MSIARIGHTQAKEGLGPELRDFLISIIPMIKASRGCESVELFQNQDDPTKFTTIEIWDSIASHQASVKNIPQDKFAEIGRLLASPASGGYYELLTEK